MRMILLAAGKGTRLRPLTDSRPKCLVELAGRTLLDWQLEAARQAGIDDVVVVGGYRAEQIVGDRFKLVVNPDYETTNMVTTLFCAERYFCNEFIMSYGDILCSPGILKTLLLDRSQVGVVVDRDWRRYWEMRFEDPMTDAESLQIGPDGQLITIGQKEPDIRRIEAQYIGLIAFRDGGVEVLRGAYARATLEQIRGQFPFNGNRRLENLYMTDLLQGMIQLGYPVKAVPIMGGWVEIDRSLDLIVAEKLIGEGRLDGPWE